MARRLSPLPAQEFVAVCARLDSHTATDGDVRSAVKHLLALLQAKAPGHSVEVRVPPFAAVQCVGGTRHVRGTPPAVVETDAATFIALGRGRLEWAEAQLRASGERSDLSEFLPLV